jgi:cobalt-zinc-cadmium efflux system outer membrane protein
MARTSMKPFLAAALLALASRAAGADAAALPTSPELPASLTLADALRVARDRAPERAMAEAAVATARAQVRTAGALPNPAASFMAGWTSQCDQPGCNHPSYLAGLGDQGAVATLVTGQRGLALDAADQGLKGAEATRQDAFRNLDFQVKQQFVNTAVGARALRFAVDQAALARETVALARKRYEAGAISDADVARLEVLQMQMEQLSDRAEQAYEQARALLAQLLGVRQGPPAFTVEAGVTSTALTPPQLAGATLATLGEEARSRRPDLAAARAQLEQARFQASLARRQVIPQFQLQAQYQQQGTPAGGWFTPPTASVGLSIPLPIFYQQQGQIGQADAGVLSAEAAVAKLEAQVLADVTTAFAALQTTQRSAQRSEQKLLARSRDARSLVQIQYDRGAASLLDYLDAQRTHLMNEIDYLTSLAAFWTAVFQLEQSVGTSYLP